MFLLVPAHPGFPGQNPHVCVCVFLILKITPYAVVHGMTDVGRMYQLRCIQLVTVVILCVICWLRTCFNVVHD